MKDNILRGKILGLLKEVYPDGVDYQTLVLILFQYHKTSDIATSLEYLVDKGYVLKKQHSHPFKEQEFVQWYKLTPQGVDLVEGNVDADPGILLLPRG
jgi:hypothetical protein